MATINQVEDNLRDTSSVLCDLSAPRVWNFMSGWVVAILHERLRLVCQVRTKDGAAMRLLVPSPVVADFRIRAGQAVIGRVAADDVVLTRLGSWNVVPHWNHWVGRVVLVEESQGNHLTTVKIKGLGWTVKSTNSIQGLDRLPRTWDLVSVVIDPERVHWRPRRVLRPRLIVTAPKE